MEVHHSHHHGQKKKIKEYFLEFLMLFIAVTLGFFAENLREKQIEQHREISYLKNVHTKTCGLISKGSILLSIQMPIACAFWIPCINL